MKAQYSLVKKKMLLVLAVTLAIGGAAPLLYCVGLFAWQLGTLFLTKSWVALPASLLFGEHSFAFVPRFAWVLPQALAWFPDRVHLGIVFAIPGLALIALGGLTALRKIAEIRFEQQREQDRLRRLSVYRRDDMHAEPFDGRREPFIGSAEMPENAKRRVA